MKELKIGEVIRIKCVEDDFSVKVKDKCNKCVFFECYGCLNECSSTHRNDGKNVHFEVVDEKSEPIDEEKLDELAENYVKHVYGSGYTDFLEQEGEAFKEGYRKAKEELV